MTIARRHEIFRARRSLRTRVRREGGREIRARAPKFPYPLPRRRLGTARVLVLLAI